MPSYQSNPGGLFNSGVYPDTRPKIDLGGILDAVGSGTGSIIHAVMQRKLAERSATMANAELTLRQKQLQTEQDRAAREAQNQENEFQLRKEAERHRFLEAGGIPASPGTPATDVTSQAPIAPVNPIRSAMTVPPVQTIGPEGTSQAPIAPPPATIHAPTLGTPATEESVDPTRARAYMQGVAIQQLRNDGFITREEARGEQQRTNQKLHDDRVAAMKAAATVGAKQIAQIRANAKASGPTKSAMLDAQANRSRLAAAADVISNAGGSYDEAQAFLAGNSPEAKTLRDAGVTNYHLMQAHAQYVEKTSGQAVRLQTGLAGLEPSEAVGAVKQTRTSVSSGNAKPEGDTAEPAPTTPAPIKKVGTPPAKAAPAAKPAPKTGAKGSAPADDFSDDEIADALKAGKTSEADVRAYITAQRASKKKK